MGTPRYGILIASLALVAVLAFMPTASADLDIRVGVAVTDVDLGEALLIAAVGEFFGLETHVVPYYWTEQRMPLPEILTAMYLARLAGVDHHTAVGLRSRGHGWGRIAKDMGIHPGTFNKLRKGFQVGSVTDVGFEEAVLIWFLSEYYHTPQSSIIGFREQGHPFLGIFLSLDFSSKSGKPPGHLLGERGQGGSWKAVGQAVGLSGEQLKHPTKPKGGQGYRPQNPDGEPLDHASSSAGQDQGQGQGKDKNGGQGQGKDKSQGKSQGKGKDK
jgi:hypothetical protein